MRSLLIALRALAVHKLRTVLAMLGIFLGALALTGVLHISTSLALKAQEETAKFGPNLIQAMAARIRFTTGEQTGTRGVATTFKIDDAVYLRDKMPMVERGVPYAEDSPAIRAGNAVVSCRLIATWPDYPLVRASRTEFGRFFTQAEEDSRAKVCVLGAVIADRLFNGREIALGKTVYMNNAALTVIGVMEEKGQDVSGTNMDEMVFAPLSTYMRRLSNVDYIRGAYLNMRPGLDPDVAAEEIRVILRERHLIRDGGKDDFHVFSSKDATRFQQEALDLVWTLGLLSSSVSFAVGALGILSIMILMVRTRRLEIGIRRAVGASRRQIMFQFLLEAGFMSGTGGILGVLLAFGLISAAYGLGGLPAVYNPLLGVGVCIAATLLGVAAGAYPAWQASRGDILEILRSAE